MRTTARRALPRTHRDTSAKWKGTTFQLLHASTRYSRFPQAGVLRLDLQANANDGKACLAAYSSRYLCQVKRHHINVVPFHLAGETRFEHATYGFGDRYSTVEPLPYQACLFYNNSKRKSRIFNCFLNFKQKIYRWTQRSDYREISFCIVRDILSLPDIRLFQTKARRVLNTVR